MISSMYPLVTIAIPTYNRADCYLKQAIHSALNQTYANIEIIISDNCSSDNTELVVKDFKDPRIRYFKHDVNIGANNNFNFCLKQAKGEWFLLLQDDDLIDKDFIETCIKSVNYDTDNVGIIRTGTRIIDSHGNVLNELPNMVGGLSTEEFFRGWFKGKTALSYLCSTLYNTDRLREIGGFHSKHQLLEDAVAVVQLAAKFGRVDVRDIKASFRKHPFERTFTIKVRDWCEDFLNLLDLMCETVSQNKTSLRSEGMRFLANICYGRASAVKSPIRRFIAYLIVFKKFNYRHPPSINHLFSSINDYFYGTPLYFILRSIKRKIERKVNEKHN